MDLNAWFCYYVLQEATLSFPFPPLTTLPTVPFIIPVIFAVVGMCTIHNTRWYMLAWGIIENCPAWQLLG